MADKLKEVRIRATKAEVLVALAAAAPALFAGYTLQDVSYFGEDPEDSSKILIVFNEEADT